MNDRPLASVVIVTYDAAEHLEECLTSVCSQSVDDYEVIVVDNGSTDGSVEYIREWFPRVRLVENETNHWFAGGNNDGMALARGEYIVGINQDVKVASDWLERLLDPLESDQKIGLTTSRIVMFDDQETLNTCGNRLHYSGLGFCRGLNEHVESFSETERVPAISGCAFAMRREVYDEIGGFDEVFEMYNEDVDLSWRARLAGYDIVHAPDSVVYHKYELSLSSWKMFRLERNRYLILLKHLRWSTLLRLLPGLLLTELLVWVYASLNGREYLKQKAKAWRWLLGHTNEIAAKRERVQRLRRRSDEELLEEMEPDLPLEQVGITGFPQRLGAPLVRLGYLPWYRLATRR